MIAAIMPSIDQEPKAVKRNRPSIRLTLAPATFELLNEAADREGLPVSRIVDRCIREALGAPAAGGKKAKGGGA